MTDKELKTLKDNLWHAADVLRSGAHLAANKYGQPILGLIFLRYADILFKQHKDEIEAEFAKRAGSRMEKTKKEIAIEKCGFFLPECAYDNFKNSGKPGLVFQINNFEIYALTWDDIFTGFDLRHGFLLNKLKINRDSISKELNAEKKEDGRDLVNRLTQNTINMEG